MGKWDDAAFRKAYYRDYNAKRKEQQRAYSAAWRQEHAVEKRDADRAYAAGHREEATTRAKAWYYSNLDRAKAARHDWYVRNVEKAKTYNLTYRSENLKKLRAYDRERNHTEKRRAMFRAISAKNSPRKVAAVREWVKNNPERARVLRQQANAQRRARMAGVVYERVDRQAVIARDKGCCGICGKEVAAKDISIDHIVPIALGGAHTMANVQLAHIRCNKRKGATLTRFC